MPDPACASCGAPLPAVSLKPTVACTFCQTTQPNPAPLSIGHEVLVRGTFSETYDLAWVTACDGPERVAIQRQQGGTSTTRLVDLIPVVAPSASDLEPGVQLFRLGMHGFEVTHLDSVQGAMAVVKHPKQGFQSDFFNDRVPVTDLRLHADPSARGRQGVFAGLDFFDVAFKAFQGAFLVVVIIVVASVIGGLTR